MNEKTGKYIYRARDNFLDGMGVPEPTEFNVDPFQKAAIDSIARGQDTLVVAPTGSGKTYIAVEAIGIALQLNGRAVYTTPLKALSNTKYLELKKRFEPKYSVGLLTGDRKINPDADVIVATTEIYRNDLYREYGKFSVVVLDEIHFISDPQRGAVWEESIILSPKDSALLMLSASISNYTEIAGWIKDVRDKECEVIRETGRPVELRLGFLHPDLGIMPMHDDSGKLFNAVTRYYGKIGLDGSGKRLKMKKEHHSKRKAKKTYGQGKKH